MPIDNLIDGGNIIAEAFLKLKIFFKINYLKLGKKSKSLKKISFSSS